MFTNVGASRLIIQLPFGLRDKEEEELVVAQASVTLSPIDPYQVSVLSVKDVKERLTKLGTEEEYSLTAFFSDLCRTYNSNRAFLSYLFGLSYEGKEEGKVYPVGMYWEYSTKRSRIKKRVIQVAVTSLKGYTIEASINTRDFIWIEDIIDLIYDSVEGVEGHPEVSKSVVEAISSMDNISWFETTVIHVKDNFHAKAERKIGRKEDV